MIEPYHGGASLGQHQRGEKAGQVRQSHVGPERGREQAVIGKDVGQQVEEQQDGGSRREYPDDGEKEVAERGPVDHRIDDDADDEVEKLKNYVQAKGEVFRSNLPFIRLYLAESRGVSYNIKAGPDEEVRKGYFDLLERLAAIFENGIQGGRLKSIASPYHLAVALDSAVNAFHLLWLDAPDRYPYPEDPDAVLNIFFKGLLDS